MNSRQQHGGIDAPVALAQRRWLRNRPRHRLPVRLGVMLSLVAAVPAAAREIRVGQSPYGDLQSAIDAVPGLRAGLRPGEPIEIVLPAGVTRVRAPVTIDAAHGGIADHPLIIRAADGTAARLSGAVPLTTRAARASDAPGIPLPPATLAIDLTPLGRTAAPQPRGAAIATPDNSVQLFQGGDWLTSATWPGNGAASFAARGTNQAGPLLTLPAAAPATLAAEPAAWVAGYWGADWEYEAAPVTRIGGGSAQVAPLRAGQPLRPAVRVRFTNLVGALAPGTFALLPKQGIALVVPAPGSARFEASLSPGILRMDGAAHVVLRGITFTRTGGDALRITRSHAILVERCGVEQAGGNGIVVSGGSGVTIRDTTIARVGERGAIIGGGDRATLTPAGHRFDGGSVSDFGRLSPSYRPGIALWGVGSTVSGASIRGGDHAAILVDGNNHLVENNTIGDVLRDTDDAGAIYLGADWTKRGNRIVGNRIARLGGARKASQLVGIYLDDQIGGTLVERNIVQGGNFGVLIGGGRDNRILGNQFLNPAGGGIWIDARGADAQRTRLPEFRRKFAAMPTGSPAWRRAYPDLATGYTGDAITPTGNVVEGNVVTGKAPLLVGPARARSLVRTR